MGTGPAGPGCAEGKALVYAMMSILHPWSSLASAAALPILGGGWFCTLCLLSIMLQRCFYLHALLQEPRLQALSRRDLVLG